MVDDDDAARESLGCLLTIESYQIGSAASGGAALALLADGLRPCVMLLDLRMPDMTGWEVWDRMRSQEALRATPVVILSGEPLDADRVRVVGIRAFLKKPGPARDVLGAVEQHCRVASLLAPPARRPRLRIGVGTARG